MPYTLSAPRTSKHPKTQTNVQVTNENLPRLELLAFVQMAMEKCPSGLGAFGRDGVGSRVLKSWTQTGLGWGESSEALALGLKVCAKQPSQMIRL